MRPWERGWLACTAATEAGALPGALGGLGRRNSAMNASEKTVDHANTPR